MNWEDCIRNNKVKEVGRNPDMAKSLFTLAKRRMESINRRKDDEFPQLLLEDYYEVIKELLTALLALRGYKSYSHECLISFLEKHYEGLLPYSEIHLINELRMLRSDILYRGRDIAEDYLVRNIESIDMIIERLTYKVEKELE